MEGGLEAQREAMIVRLLRDNRVSEGQFILITEQYKKRKPILNKTNFKLQINHFQPEPTNTKKETHTIKIHKSKKRETPQSREKEQGKSINKFFFKILDSQPMPIPPE
jgi:hypothetical protein